MKPGLVERLGGPAAVERVVHRFYSGVAGDALLRPLYPEDLGPAERRLAMFLVQMAGGPRDYEAARGEPKLRLRHLPFAIGRPERDAWMARMAAAVAAEALPTAAGQELLQALARLADFLVNADGLSLRGAGGLPVGHRRAMPRQEEAPGD